MDLKTHLQIDNSLSGELITLSRGFAKVKLKTSKKMRADDKGLVHGGFIFSAADFCAMSAVNDKNVVLGSADIKFIAPVKVEDEVIFEGKVTKIDGKKHLVKVKGFVEKKEVFSGEFVSFVLDEHVLK